MKYIFLFILSFSSYATELHMSEEQAIREGYKRVEYDQKYIFGSLKALIAPHALDWPFERPYGRGFLGNNFIQHQPYEDVVNGGYHGGNDMVLEKNSWVLAPISGVLEAGHYTYVDFDNGGREKFWKPYPEHGSASSFEIAVTDANGLRYELHHIERESMPQEILDCLKIKPCLVQKGVRVGTVYTWSTFFHYHHVHVNIIDQNTGLWWNPEYFFKLLQDDIAPDVKVLAVDKTGQNFWLESGQIIDSAIEKFVVIGVDKKNDSHFDQMPIHIRISFEHGGQFEYDYRTNLGNDFNNFPDISDIYPKRVLLPNGRSARQTMRSSYYPLDANYLMNLSIPSNRGNGNFTIEVGDMAGNTTRFKGSVHLP